MMRYEKGRRAASRERIVAAASRRFREDGLTGTGIAGIMTEAGLTVGAFSGHFESKEQLLREVMHDALAAQEARVAGGGIARIIAEYLSPGHRDDMAAGCVTSALAPEIARQSNEMRQDYTDRLLSVIDAITSDLQLSDPETARRLGLTIFGQLVGALQLSRAITDGTLSLQILEDASRAAMALVNAAVTDPSSRADRPSA